MSKIVFEGKTSEGTSYLIRYPKESDLLPLLEFVNEIAKEKTFVSVQEELTLDQEKDWLTNQIENIQRNQTVYLLVEAQDKIVGVSDINMVQIQIGPHVGRFGIMIAKDYRQQGIGKQLITTVLDQAKKNLSPLKIILLGVFSNNPVAKKLYEEFGFKEYGRLPKGILHRGEYVDDIKMYKEI